METVIEKLNNKIKEQGHLWERTRSFFYDPMHGLWILAIRRNSIFSPQIPSADTHTHPHVLPCSCNQSVPIPVTETLHLHVSLVLYWLGDLSSAYKHTLLTPAWKTNFKKHWYCRGSGVTPKCASEVSRLFWAQSNWDPEGSGETPASP